MSNYYLSVCTDGHLIDAEKAEDVTVQQIDINDPLTPEKIANPEYTVPFAYCPDCGSVVRSTCPECSYPIQTEYNGRPYPEEDSIPSYCHGCGEAHPWTSPVEAKKQREGDFIGIDDSEIDGQFYPELIHEINLCFKVKADHAALVLNRKLIESLIADILRSAFGMEEKELFFDNRQLPLSALLDNLKSRSNELEKYGVTLDEEFFRSVGELKYRGDASAHAIEEDLSQVDMEAKSEVATTISKILFRLRIEAKTAHRK